MTTARLTTSDELDDTVTVLADHKTEWARLDYPSRLALLAELRRRVGAAAPDWVDAAVRPKGIAADGRTAAEEWLSGPYTTLTAIAALHRSIARLWQGDTTFDPGWVSAGPKGRTVVTAVPVSLQDKLLFSGYTGEVWIGPEQADTPLQEQTAAFYRGRDGPGRVCVVLGAGNMSSIPVLDTLYKMFVEGQVVVLKMSPVLDHLGGILETMLQPLLAAGYLRIAYGGTEVGGLLTGHSGVDTIHITGSRRSHDAIVFGPGEEGSRRRVANTPVMTKPVSSELGGVSPLIVVPGPWRRADLAHHAELVATSKLLNGGFNCISTQVLILSDRWEHTDDFLRRIEETIAGMAPRPAYYPGAAGRMARAMASHHDVVPLGGDPPRAHLRHIPAGSHHQVFDEEVFAPVLASTRLEHGDPADFLAAAVHFANHCLDGTLGANLLIHPETATRLGNRFTGAVTDLRYGCVAINTWTGFGFAQPRLPWGGYQGEPSHGSGSGTGVVHNALMFDHPEKAVVTGPFFRARRSWRGGGLNLAPRPPWFVTNETALTTARRLTAHATDGSLRHLPGIVASALLG
ncbi:MAG: aldehyde dehydrogenase family protein [Actinomycetota bacterium]|nr:aldehyde dehydrogenase family protein [Actinomycetota bacterium]